MKTFQFLCFKHDKNNSVWREIHGEFIPGFQIQELWHKILQEVVLVKAILYKSFSPNWRVN
jgi:hypothetical protein